MLGSSQLVFEFEVVLIQAGAEKKENLQQRVCIIQWRLNCTVLLLCNIICAVLSGSTP